MEQQQTHKSSFLNVGDSEGFRNVRFKNLYSFVWNIILICRKPPVNQSMHFCKDISDK